MGSRQANEGEGNRTAAREYNSATQAFAKSGKVKGAAKSAKQALDTSERSKLRKAESEGRKHAQGVPEI